MGKLRNSLPLQGASSLASEDRTQAMCMHIETPAKPQTTKLSLSIFCPAQLAVSEVDEDQKQRQ